MAVVNPFAADPDRGGVWEEGYDAGFAEPEAEHLPPYEGELFDVYAQGESTGRDDRRNQPAIQDRFPSSPNDAVSRFEAAPDGLLIAVPDEAPEGHPIRADAQVSVSPRTAAGYYVAVFNGAADADVGGETAGEFVAHVWIEENIILLEKVLAAAFREGAHGAIKFGGLVLGVVLSLFSSSPILTEYRFRGYLDDGTPVVYLIMQPEE